MAAPRTSPGAVCWTGLSGSPEWPMGWRRGAARAVSAVVVRGTPPPRCAPRPLQERSTQQPPPPRPSPPHHPGAATLSACLHAAAASSGGGGRARRAGRHPPLLARMPKGQRDWGRVDPTRSSKNLVWPAASLSAPLTRRDHSSGGDTGGNAAPLTGAVKGPSGVGNTCWHSLLGRLSVRLSAAGSPAWTGRLASGARTPVGGENGSLRASRDG